MAVVFVTIAPLGTATPSVSRYVAGVERILRKSGLVHQLTAMGTIIEGDLDAILAVVREMHEAPVRRRARSGCRPSSRSTTGATRSTPSRARCARWRRSSGNPGSRRRVARSPHHEHRAGARPVGADDERLLDVGGLGRPGDEERRSRGAAA